MISNHEDEISYDLNETTNFKPNCVSIASSHSSADENENDIETNAEEKDLEIQTNITMYAGQVPVRIERSFSRKI